MAVLSEGTCSPLLHDSLLVIWGSDAQWTVYMYMYRPAVRGLWEKEQYIRISLTVYLGVWVCLTEDLYMRER